MTRSRVDVKVAFGRAVRRHRLGRRPHLSQEKLAELAGLHRTYASSVERGLNNISLENIQKLSAALGLPLGRLFETVDEELRRAG